MQSIDALLKSKFENLRNQGPSMKPYTQILINALQMIVTLAMKRRDDLLNDLAFFAAPEMRRVTIIPVLIAPDGSSWRHDFKEDRARHKQFFARESSTVQIEDDIWRCIEHPMRISFGAPEGAIELKDRSDLRCRIISSSSAPDYNVIRRLLTDTLSDLAEIEACLRNPASLEIWIEQRLTNDKKSERDAHHFLADFFEHELRFDAKRTPELLNEALVQAFQSTSAPHSRSTKKTARE